MYLGIDFILSPGQNPYVVEVNVGLPGGAQEYHLTHLVHFGKPSDIFDRIEETSKRVYGKTFKDYLHSLPHIESLKPFKIWMDGRGPIPNTLHPGLRLEDKWVQYQMVKLLAPMPETMVFDPGDLKEAERLLKERGKLALKRRLGRGGRGFRIIDDPGSLATVDTEGQPYLLQELIESKVTGYTFSIRSVALGGEFMCMYANLSQRNYSNHGLLTFVSAGDSFGLSAREFGTTSFNQKSWEAEIWFGKDTPSYLRHNLYEEEVARTTLCLPASLYQRIIEASVRIERHYERFDLLTLPKACFEGR